MVNINEFDAATASLLSAKLAHASNPNPASWKNLLTNFAKQIGSQQCCESNGLAQRLLNEKGPQRPIVLLEGIGLTALQAVSGIESVSFDRWEKELKEAKSLYQALQQVTPQQSQMAMGPIQTRQNQLRERIRSLQIGGSKSVTGALVGTNLEPLQSEWVSILRVIQTALITPDHRQVLMNTQDELRKLLEGKVIAAGREGKDVSKAIDNLNKTMDDALNEAKCYVVGSTWDKVKCFFGGSAKWIVVGGVAISTVVGLWVLRPYVALYLESQKRKKYPFRGSFKKNRKQK